jgi:hypothetical protein
VTSAAPSTRRRLLPVLLVLASLGGIVALQVMKGMDEPTAVRPPLPAGVGSIRACPLPTQVALPSWYPKDLPLPPGSFASSVDAAGAGIRVVSLVVREPLEETIRFIGQTWAKQGWKLGQGERERFEAENVFWKSDVRYGRFRINVLCSTEWTAVTLALADPAWDEK